MTVQIAYARRPLSRKQSFAGLTPLGPDQFEGYASLFEVPDGAGDVMAPGAFAASLRRRGAAEVRLLYHTPRLGLPDLPDTPELYADTVADAFWRLDALTDLYLKGQFVNTPPSSPADGDAYLVGGAPSGGWSGQPYKIAACRDGGWQFLTPFDGLRGWVEGSGCFIVYQDGVWTDCNALISAAEGSIASTATCDIGAAGSLFVAVTGTTTITSFGTTANRLRFLRFAGALTLTHNATSLLLPGAANIATAAGDTAIFASDGSGNWRCRSYNRADGRMVNMASPSFGGTVTGPDSGTWGSGGFSNLARARVGAGAGQFNANEVLTCVSASLGVPAGTFKGDGNGSPGPVVAVMGTASSGHMIDFYSTAASAIVGSVGYTTAGTSYATSSDARLKTVPAAQGDYRAAIQALWVGDFTWKDSGAPGFGVLAQQAYDVMPNHQGVVRPAEESGTWQASAEPFGHLALWGVKDLYALAEALAARIARLEAAHDDG